MKLFCWKVLGVEHIGKQGFARGIDTKKGKKETKPTLVQMALKSLS